MPFLAIIFSWFGGFGSIIKSAGQFILKYWKFFLVAALVGFIVYQNHFATRFLFDVETIPHLQQEIVQQKGQIDNLTTSLNTAVADNKKLTTSISELNSTVLQWKGVSDQLKVAHDQLNVQLQNLRVEDNKKIQSILNAPTPQTCEGSIDYLRDEAQKLDY